MKTGSARINDNNKERKRLKITVEQAEMTISPDWNQRMEDFRSSNIQNPEI